VRTLLASGVCQARAGLWAEAETTLMRAYDAIRPTRHCRQSSEVLLHQGAYERARFYMRRVNGVKNQSNAQTFGSLPESR